MVVRLHIYVKTKLFKLSFCFDRTINEGRESNMNLESVLNYAGDLSVELEEMEKLIPDEEQMESAYTYTFMCGTLLTLKCC